MTDTAADRSVGESPGRDGPPPAASSRGRWRPLLVRLHFYAGVLVAPFVFIACLTGLLFVFAPQIERVADAKLLVVEHPGTDPLPINQQVARAVAAAPGLNLTSVVPNARPDETTRVNFIRPSGSSATNYTVFVNPYTGVVQGTKDTSVHGGAMPFSTWVVEFHSNLGLGQAGRWYSELASLWLVVLTLSGLVVWWQRSAVHRKVTSAAFWRKFAVVERGRRPGVKRTMSWHSTVGVWTAILAILFGLTGLPFAQISGPKWMSAVGATNPHEGKGQGGQGQGGGQGPGGGQGEGGGQGQGGGQGPGGGQGQGGGPGGGRGQGGGPGGGGGRGQGGGHGPGGGAGMPVGFASSAKADFDTMAKNAAAVGVSAHVRFTAPTSPGAAWMVTEEKPDLPIEADSALVEPTSFAVVSSVDWDTSTAAIDKLNRWILLFHTGRIFGFVGQIIFGLAMLSVLWIIWWGYKMWWQRRPRGTVWRFGKAPARGSWRKAPRVSLVIWTVVTLMVFWVFPVLAYSSLAFLLIDVVVGRIRARPRRSPGVTG